MEPEGTEGVETRGTGPERSRVRMWKSNDLTVDWISRRTETSRGSEGRAEALLGGISTGGALAAEAVSCAVPEGTGGRDVPVGETRGVEASSMTESASDSETSASEEGIDVVEWMDMGWDGSRPVVETCTLCLWRGEVPTGEGHADLGVRTTEVQS